MKLSFIIAKLDKPFRLSRVEKFDTLAIKVSKNNSYKIHTWINIMETS